MSGPFSTGSPRRMPGTFHHAVWPEFPFQILSSSLPSLESEKAQWRGGNGTNIPRNLFSSPP